MPAHGFALLTESYHFYCRWCTVLIHSFGASGRGWTDYPLELPSSNGGLEAGTCTCNWVHCCFETSRADTTNCPSHRCPCQRGTKRKCYMTMKIMLCPHCKFFLSNL